MLSSALKWAQNWAPLKTFWAWAQGLEKIERECCQNFWAHYLQKKHFAATNFTMLIIHSFFKENIFIIIIIHFSLLNDCISRTSDKVAVGNKFELSPHMTLIKVNRPIARLRKSKYLPSALYESHENDFFGLQNVDNLQLCVIENTTRADGFYSTLTEIDLS